ncbi:alpha/beta hydrolase [Candidatus Pelagibacter sp.]|jgi:pimeloyl-ACP methyl ester carboxylesterase|nr:alpha/beta hydrolase [Candidatus Pelagibacter bacterium]MDB9808043.1 alpha/beta hydrolase [Candidatus Pelagibacter sp.]MDB2527414.1 alpha/beta hydrolase [Candidatus Pelagibacter bacterium]MDC0364345.1 alpha/beta hydrolase [Candidatus Pelagibacter sp.]MDC0947396.1 alpha/beta hydrolase [Candidatus Pelagibacter sp.]
MSQGSDSNQNYYSFIDNNTTPLVFIHGVGLDHQMWKPQTNSLNEYSTITYDLLGHGKTPFNKEEITLDDFSKQLLSVLDFLKVDKCNLVGFSLGSLIALDFASKFQSRLKSLTVIGTTYKRTDNERALVVDRFNQAKLNKPISKQALKRWFSDEYLKTHPEVYNQFMKILNKEPKEHSNFLKAYKLFAYHYDNLEMIKRISTKTLIMTGADDSGSTVAMSKSLSSDLINSSFIEINNGKHLCSIECADDVNINIKNFIDN